MWEDAFAQNGVHGPSRGTGLRFGCGIAADMMLATPDGLRAAGEIGMGDLLRSLQDGPVTVVAQRAADAGQWLRIPPLALGNRREILVAAGQGLLIETVYAARLVGSLAVVVPALALRHWRGIAPAKAPAEAVSFTLSRPAMVLGGAGVLLAMDGPANAPLMAQDLPPVPSLSLATAQQLIACLIAYDAGAALRALPNQAAAR